MSQIAIKGATTGTGVFTLESPATNTDRTLILPDEAGTVLTTAGVPASAMPAGSVLQVVQVSSRSNIAITVNATWTDTGLSASITPSNTSSKILVLVRATVLVDRISGADNLGLVGIYRDSTQLGDTFGMVRAYDRGSSGIQLQFPFVVNYLDTPNTTNSVEYSIYGYRNTGTSTFSFNPSEGIQFDGNSTSATTIILMEIAG